MSRLTGRPREHDRDQIALDLIKWAQRDDSINLNHFCSSNLLAPSKISQWAKEDDSFRQAYEIAKSFIGYRREMLLNQDMLHVKAYDLNAAVYDYFLKEERRAQAEFESDLKSKEDKAASQQFVEKYDAFINQLERLQDGNSDLRKTDSNINNEQ